LLLQQHHSTSKRETSSLKLKHCHLKQEHSRLEQKYSHWEQERSRLEQEHSHLKQERSRSEDERPSSEHERPSSEHESPSLSDRIFQFDRGTLCTKLAYSGFWGMRSRKFAKFSPHLTVQGWFNPNCCSKISNACIYNGSAST
jgi:hypothetical protein